ncbi:MAG: protein-L-isoaspartate(D-aspartate) O-methyltransferase [Halobacteriota archaeon]
MGIKIRELQSKMGDNINENSLKKQREILISKLKKRGISERVLNAVREVKREDFIPPELRQLAYVDEPLPIGDNQTISAPHMVAIMCELLEIQSADHILEVGTGSGYHAAIMAQLLDDGIVYTIERSKRLAIEATKRLPPTVVVIVGDGSLGLPDKAPFDKISVTCSAPDIPPPLLSQLKPGGLMVIPVGRWMQELYLIKKTNGIQKIKEGNVAFVPLIGTYGFKD